MLSRKKIGLLIVLVAVLGVAVWLFVSDAKRPADTTTGTGTATNPITGTDTGTPTATPTAQPTGTDTGTDPTQTYGTNPGGGGNASYGGPAQVLINRGI